jgi:hypothetical protein
MVVGAAPQPGIEALELPARNVGDGVHHVKERHAGTVLDRQPACDLEQARRAWPERDGDEDVLEAIGHDPEASNVPVMLAANSGIRSHTRQSRASRVLVRGRAGAGTSVPVSRVHFLLSLP